MSADAGSPAKRSALGVIAAGWAILVTVLYLLEFRTELGALLR